MISATLMGAGVFGLGVGIGFVWGELKASHEFQQAEKRKDINRLRREQNSITGDNSGNEKSL